MSAERSFHGNGRFAEGQVWECRNLEKGHTCNIDGPLAEVLRYYPDWFDLRYIGPKDKHSPIRKKTVNGCVKDRNAEKWRYRDMIPVK